MVCRSTSGGWHLPRARVGVTVGWAMAAQRYEVNFLRLTAVQLSWSIVRVLHRAFWFRPYTVTPSCMSSPSHACKGPQIGMYGIDVFLRNAWAAAVIPTVHRTDLSLCMSVCCSLGCALIANVVRSFSPHAYSVRLGCSSEIRFLCYRELAVSLAASAMSRSMERLSSDGPVRSLSRACLQPCQCNPHFVANCLMSLRSD